MRKVEFPPAAILRRSRDLFFPALGGSMLLLAACAAAPVKDTDIGPLRQELTTLEATPELASRAPIEIRSAEAALVLAQQSASDPMLVAHRVYIAERKIGIARALAENRYAQDQFQVLKQQLDQKLSPAVAAAPVGVAPMDPVETLPAPEPSSVQPDPAVRLQPSPAPTISPEPSRERSPVPLAPGSGSGSD